MIKEQELLQLKQRMEEAKTEVSELTGRMKHLIEVLKKDWGCSSLEEAEAKLQQIRAKIEELTQKIEQGVEAMKGKYQYE